MEEQSQANTHTTYKSKQQSCSATVVQVKSQPQKWLNCPLAQKRYHYYCMRKFQCTRGAWWAHACTRGAWWVGVVH